MAAIAEVQTVVDIGGKLITAGAILIGGVYAFLKTRKHRELEECIMINATCHHSLADARRTGILEVVVQVEIQNVGGSVVHGLRLDAQLDFVPAVEGVAPDKYSRPLDRSVPGAAPNYAGEHFTIDKGERNVFVFPCRLRLPQSMPLAYRIWVEYTCTRKLDHGSNLSWVYERMHPLA